MPRDIRNTPLQEELFRTLGGRDDLTAHVVSDLFAYHKGRGIRYNVDDIIEIGPAQSPYVKPHSVTTVGIYVANKVLFEDLEVFGYINKVMTQKRWETIERKIADARIAGDISVQQVHDYIDRSQYLLGGPLAHIINPSLSTTVLNLPIKAAKLRNDLVKEKTGRIRAGDPYVSKEITDAVVKEALVSMHAKDDPSVSLFDSGAIDPFNNYRTMFVMKGAIRDNTGESPTGYKIVTSNYDDGITKTDMPIIADSLVTSQYNKGVATQDAGVLNKKYNAVLQRVKLRPRYSDCGSSQTRAVTLTGENKEKYLYRNIMVRGKLVTLTPEVIDGYVGQTVQMRTPIHCKAHDPEYCWACMGDRLYRVGVKNIGLTFGTMAGSLLNANMKTFHDISIKTSRVGVPQLMKYVN